MHGRSGDTPRADYFLKINDQWSREIGSFSESELRVLFAYKKFFPTINLNNSKKIYKKYVNCNFSSRGVNSFPTSHYTYITSLIFFSALHGFSHLGVIPFLL